MTGTGREAGGLQGVAAAAYLAMAAVSLTGSRELVYDEVYYVRQTVDLFHRLGPTSAFLDAYPYPAGLPNAVLLAPLDPLGGLRPPAVRVYNLVLLLGVWAGVALLTRPAGGPGWAGMALANPVVWVLAGLALTEMLAVLAATWAAVILRRPPPGRSAAGEAGAGVVYAAAVLVRPQLLVLAPVYLLLVWDRPTRRWAGVAAFAAAAAAVAGPVFAHWGDLVSPAVTAAAFYASDRAAPEHAVLGLAYAGVMMGLLAPGWFALSRGWLAVAAGLGVAAAVANVAVGGVSVAPAAPIAGRLLPAGLVPLYPRMMGGVAAAGATVVAVVLVRRLADYREVGPAVAASVLAVGLLAVSCAKVTHQFSSRYVAVGFPFMLLAAAPYRSGGWGEVGRLAVGAVLGAAMLRTYFG
jgi:hypothetical protein